MFLVLDLDMNQSSTSLTHFSLTCWLLEGMEGTPPVQYPVSYGACSLTRCVDMSFPKIGDTFFGVPIIRVIAFQDRVGVPALMETTI